MKHIYGINTVLAFLQTKPAEGRSLWIGTAPSQRAKTDPRLKKILQLAESAEIPITQKPLVALHETTQGAVHQGVVLFCGAPKAAATHSPTHAPIESIGELLAQNPTPFLLVLDGIQDPHNLGACIRTACAAGIDAVIAPRDRAVGLTPVVHKVASGAAAIVPFIPVTNLSRALAELKEAGVWIVGLAGDAPTSLYQVDLKGPLALVVGNEGEGLRRLTREHCDVLAALPMAVDAVSSLNVSVAAGVALFEAVRQRR